MQNEVDIDSDYVFDEEDIQRFHDWYGDCKDSMGGAIKEMQDALDKVVDKHGGKSQQVQNRLLFIAKLKEVEDQLDINYGSVIDTRRMLVRFVFKFREIMGGDELPGKITKKQKEELAEEMKPLVRMYDYNKVFLGKVTAFSFYEKHLIEGK